MGTDAKQMYEDIKKYMSELSCSTILGADKCAKIHKLADLLSVNFDKVVLKLKEFYENGITSVVELYQKIAAWVSGIFGDEIEATFMEKRGIIDLYKFVKEKVQALLAKLRTLPGMTDEALKKIQAKIDEFIKSGKIQAIAQYIVDLVDKYFPQSDTVPAMEISLQDFKCTETLKAILSEEFCKNIEDMAAKLHLSYDEVMKIINNVKDMGTYAKQMYEDIKKYMSELSCSTILGADKCAKIHKLAD